MEDFEWLAPGGHQKIADKIRDALDNKADTDGYYTMLTAGAADNLTARGDGVTASFLYRTTAGSASVPDEGEATVRSIKGRTLGWNQLSNSVWPRTQNVSGLTITVSDNTISAHGTVGSDFTTGRFAISENIALKRDGRKYLFMANKDLGHDLTLNGYNGARGRNGFIWSNTAGTDWQGGVQVVANPGDVFDFDGAKGMIFDLTAMFGAGNEPSTVDEFTALYPLPYYAYDAGTMLPVRMTGVETNGFNQWDGTYTNGGLDASTGAEISNASWSRTGFIPVFPQTEYYLKSVGNEGYKPFYYAADKSFVGTIAGGMNLRNATFTTAAGAYYVRLMCNVASMPSEMCINLHWSGYMDGTYEQYWSEQRVIAAIAENFPDGMRSAGTVADELTETQAITRVGERAYQSGDESDPTVVTDGTITHYALATPTTTTFDQPINMDYRFADFGTERILVPTGQMSAPPTMDVVYGLNATDTLRTLPTEYVSKASDASFTAALGAFLNATITRVWNETQGRYDYTITANGE